MIDSIYPVATLYTYPFFCLVELDAYTLYLRPRECSLPVESVGGGGDLSVIEVSRIQSA